MMLLSLEHYLIQKGSNMGVIIKFPLMDVADEEDYKGDKTTVVDADEELSYLVYRFFALSSNLDYRKTSVLLKVIPSKIRRKKIEEMSEELKCVVNRIQDKVYN